jgi:hypothetical protein
MQFDLTSLVQKFADTDIMSGNVTSYKLKMKNAVPRDRILEREGSFTQLDKVIASSYDLIAFPISTAWDEGRGYDLLESEFVFTRYGVPRITGYSNWNSATTLTAWGEAGVYANPTASTANTSSQHFSLGSEDIDMDITAMVQNWITGGTNNGLGIAYARPYELTSSDTQSFSSFFTQHTNTSFKPYIEVNYSQLIEDDLNYISTNRTSKVFLYTFSGDAAANYTSIGSVNVTDTNGTAIHSNLAVTQVEKGVYYVNFLMSSATVGQRYHVVWNDVVFETGIDTTIFTQKFNVKENYYQRFPSVNEYAVDIYGIENGSTIKSEDVVKVFVELRSNYNSLNAPSNPYKIFYRIIMNNQEEVQPWERLNRVVLDKDQMHYFSLDTSWLLHNQSYRIEFKVQEFGTNRTLPEKVEFKVLNPF